MLRSFRYQLIAALLLISAPLVAQVQFSIKVGANEIGKKDELQVQYIITGAGNAMHFQPPEFKKWQLLAGPVINTDYVIDNGKKRIYTSYTYFLSPTATGTLKIPTTSVEADGKIYHCAEEKVTVLRKEHVEGVNTATAPPTDMTFEEKGAEEETLQPGEDALKKIRNNLFIKAFPSKQKVYVGEPLLVEYKLYTRLRSSSRVIKQPSFTNCSVSDITSDVISSDEKLNGRKFVCKQFRKVQLIPLQPGRITIAATTLENEVTFINGGADLRDLYYDRPSQNTYTLALSSDPLSIDVIPLPDNANRLPVGNFTISARLKKETHAINETNALVITISGSGNFTPVSEPDIAWPAHLYHFDATETDTIDKHTFPFTGSRIYEIPYEADTTGRITIPSFAFRFFNPAKGAVETVITQPIVTTVTRAVLRTDNNPSSAGATNNRLFVYGLYAIPVMVAVCGFIILKRRRKKRRLVQKEIPATETTIDASNSGEVFDPRESFNNLLLVQGDAEFYHKAHALAQQLMLSGNGDSSLLEQILNDCNTMLYTPLPVTSKKEILEKLQKAIL